MKHPGNFLLCCLFLSFLQIFSCAQEQPETDFEFEIKGEEGNKAATITKYVGEPKDVRIPKKIQGCPVTGIGDAAFTEIKDKKFVGLGLTSVTIPDGVTEIGWSAFSGNKIKEVTIPDSVTSIPAQAFSTNQLTKVTIPESVTAIGDRAFVGNQLTRIDIPVGVKSIGVAAFAVNHLTSVTLPDGITSIADSAFSENRLSNVAIPVGVTSIGDDAFHKNKLTSVTIPEGVTSIGKNAFDENAIISVTIGNNVKLGERSFLPVFISQYNSGGKKSGTYALPEKESGISGGSYLYFKNQFNQFVMGYMMLNMPEYMSFKQAAGSEAELKKLPDSAKCPFLLITLFGAAGEDAIRDAVMNTNLGMVSWETLFELVKESIFRKNYAQQKMLIKSFNPTGDANSIF
jgi:hypothetical protein